MHAKRLHIAALAQGSFHIGCAKRANTTTIEMAMLTGVLGIWEEIIDTAIPPRESHLSNVSPLAFLCSGIEPKG